MLGIYHADCLDGQAGAWVLAQAFGEDGIELVSGVHGNAPPDVSGHDVILVDFSYKRPVLLEMATQANSILILDHHQSAQAELVDLPANVTAIFDMERCGAALAWLHFFPDRRLPDLIAHIEDRDLWRFVLPGTREITAALGSYPYVLRVWDWLIARDISKLLAEGEPIIRQRDMDVKEMLTTMVYRAEVAGYDVPMLNAAPKLVADAGHELCKGEHFSVCYYDTPHQRVFSLRSDASGADVSLIAVQFGGGGHKHAAGFRLPREHAHRLHANPVTFLDVRRAGVHALAINRQAKAS